MCWPWAKDFPSGFCLTVPTNEYPCIPPGFLYGIGAVGLFSNCFPFTGTCLLHLVLNNLKRWKSSSIIFQFTFFQSSCPLLEQQLSYFNVHNKPHHGTCYNCHIPGPSPRSIGLEWDWGFQNDFEAGNTQMTLKKGMDFILLLDKLYIIIFK